MSKGYNETKKGYSKPTCRREKKTNWKELKSIIDFFHFNNFKWSGLNRDSLFRIKNDDIVYPRIALQIANTPVNIHIDTMSSINVIDEVTFKLFNPLPILKEHSKPAFPYGTNKPIKFLGEFLAPVRAANKHVRAIFVVAEGNFGSLLGYPTAKKLGVDPVSQILYSIVVYSSVAKNNRCRKSASSSMKRYFYLYVKSY